MLSTRAALNLCIKLSLCAGLIIAPLAEGATDSAKMEVLQRWKLGGDGGWDYLAADPAKERLFISRATRVDVISTASGKLIGSIPDTKGVHGLPRRRPGQGASVHQPRNARRCDQHRIGQTHRIHCGYPGRARHCAGQRLESRLHQQRPVEFSDGL